MIDKKEEIVIHSIKYNFLMNVILKISQFVFPLITFPYISRVLGAEANGKIGFAAAFVSYFSLIASLGIPSYGIRKCAEVRNDRDKLSQTVRELLTINSICLIITYSLFLLTVLLVPKIQKECSLMLVTSLSIVFNVLGVDWFYQAIEQYRYITIRNIVFKLIGIVMMFLFIHSPKDYILYAGITVFASVGSNILNIIRLRKYIDFRNTKIEKTQLLIHLSPILLLFLYNATTPIYSSLDQVMLGFMKTDTIVGYYSASIKIKNIITGFITALGAVMLPRLSFYLNNGERAKFEQLIKKSISFILVCSLPIACYFVLEAKPIIILLAGEEYLPSAIILKALMPAIVFIGLSSITAWQLLIPLKKEKITVLGAVLGAFTDLVINMAMIPKYGAFGAAIGTTVAEGVVLITHSFFLIDIIALSFDINELLKTTAGTILSAIVLIILNKFIINIHVFWQCFYSASLFFGLYLMLLYFFKEDVFMEYGMGIIKHIKTIRD